MKAVIVPPANAIRFEWVTGHQEFLALKAQWELLGSSAVQTVFLTYDWLAAWLENLAGDAELHVMTAWEGERLVAALPLFGSATAGRGRRWAIMGTGTLTPNHLDIIADPESLESARDGFVKMLLDAASDWDVLELDKLPADSDTAETLTAAFEEAGFVTMRAVTATCPYCDLPATGEEYYLSRKKQIRKTIRQVRRWYEERPEERVLSLAKTEEEALEAFGQLVRMHQSRWKGKGYPGAFADPRVVRFHEQVVRAASRRGYLRIYTLTDGGEMAAVSYNYRVGPTVQGYLSSFDFRWAETSPGVLLRIYVMEESIAEGARRFDFLEGTESYKAAWCTGGRENLRLLVFNRTLAGSAARLKHAADETTVLVARKLVPPDLRERTVKALARRKAAWPGAEGGSDSGD